MGPFTRFFSQRLEEAIVAKPGVSYNPDIRLGKFHSNSAEHLNGLDMLAIGGNSLQQGINQAAKTVGLSYKAAWERIETLNNLSPQPLITRQIGGSGGGGTILTEAGRLFLARALLFQRHLQKLLAGLTAADSGHIRLDDTVIFDSSQHINCKPEERRIGVVFQYAHLFPHMSVRRNALYGYKRTAKANRRIDPDALFKVLGIDSLQQRNVVSLSGGEHQRVALARTVLTCPRLILMDEPLNGLDEELKFQIIPYLNRVFSEYAIPLLFISHSLLEMRMMTHEVLVMEKGRIRQHIETEELARTSWDTGRRGYINLLTLGPSRPHHDLFSYEWGENRLILTEPGIAEENLFELDAREIILFKRHPEATSARNLLKCTVKHVYMSGNRVRVELESGNGQIIAQIVPESVQELAIKKGCQLVAAIKASAFSKIF